MAENTGIEWTDSTWSPLRVQVKADAAAIAAEKGFTSLVKIADRTAGQIGPHCEHVSPGCENCYAETNNHRCLPANGTGLPYDRRSRDLVEPFIDMKALVAPAKWKPMIAIKEDAGGNQVETSRPRMIFVENQSDLFGEWWTDEQRDLVFAVMAICRHHRYQVLTKRAQAMHRYVTARQIGTPEYAAFERSLNRVAFECGLRAVPTLAQFCGKNVWLGASVEDQKTADERIPWLLQTPAAIRFLSAEPLLAEIELSRIRCPEDRFGWIDVNALTGATYRHAHQVGFGHPRLGWAICGGESGRHARPMHPDWARSLRDQCVAASVPFFFKQWGEWRPFEGATDAEAREAPNLHVKSGDVHFWRVGKKAAGAMLDGREWREFPKGSPCE